MTKRQKQKIVVLFIAVGISLFSYSKDYLIREFPELSGTFLFPSGDEAEVKGQSTLLRVIRVIDGDTIVVSLGEKDEKVRLIGVDTPETVDPRRPLECFGKEAKNYLNLVLAGKNIRLEPDTTQSDRDKYGRLLRYVFLENGTNVNHHLIKDGYAFEYTYDLPYKYRAEFKQAEFEAKTANKGLWNKESCNGER